MLKSFDIIGLTDKRTSSQTKVEPFNTAIRLPKLGISVHSIHQSQTLKLAKGKQTVTKLQPVPSTRPNSEYHACPTPSLLSPQGKKAWGCLVSKDKRVTKARPPAGKLAHWMQHAIFFPCYLRTCCKAHPISKWPWMFMNKVIIWRTACTISLTLMTAPHIYRIEKGKQQESTKGKTMSTTQKLISPQSPSKEEKTQRKTAESISQ